MTRKKQQKKKVEIVFDPQKRKEFLTGFQKRKNERRTRAKKELEKNLKEERKRIRQEVKDGFKHMKKSFEPLRELTEEDKTENQDTYEDDEVEVKIVELSTNDLTGQRNMLGANCADSSESEDEAMPEENDDANDSNCIPGMDLNVNSKRKKAKPNESESETPPEADFKSKKDLDKLMKTKTLKKIKKSKLFKMKERIDNKVNQKKSIRDRYKTIKSVPKHQRKKLKLSNPQQSRYRKGRLMNKKEIRRMRSGN